MKITYVTYDTELWGGIYVVFQHIQLLAEAGHDAFLTTPAAGPDWYPLTVPIHRISHVAADLIPESDILVATSWNTVEAVANSKKGMPVHLCQGYEGDYKELRPHKAAIEAAYSCDIPKLTVSRHLQTFLKDRFHSETYYVGQMVDRNIFYPSQSPHAKSSGSPFSILVVGPFQADFKNIATALKGIRLARDRLKRPVKLVRVSQFLLSEEEKEIMTPDAYHFHVPHHEMGRFYREADLFVSMSKEAEGFGLPAVEALSCGVPAILSTITSYTSFDPAPDYARFVDPLDVEGLADAIVETVRNPSLRKNLIRGGLRVAGKFTRECLQSRLTQALTTIHEKEPAQKTSQFWNEYHVNKAPDGRVSWWDSPVIVRACQRAITGDPNMTIYRFLENHLPHRPVERGLSICCGSGEFERGLLDHNLCRRIDAFDISEARVKAGIRMAKEGNYAIHFHVQDVNRAVFTKNRYDVCFSWSALHHIENLEGVCNNMAEALKDHGRFVIQEYIGPNRLQWTGRQLAIANMLLKLLPARLRTDRLTGEIITEIQRPSIRHMNRTDPSEAVRSQEIIAVLDRFFSIQTIRFFGGSIYHPLFNRIMGNFDPHSKRDTALIRMILVLERMLIKGKLLHNDYALILAQKA